MKTAFPNASQLPDEAQLWVFGFSEPFTPGDQRRVCEAVEEFLPRWQSHGSPVIGAYEIVEDRFVLVAAHCPTKVSGCSIDSTFKVFKDLQREGLDGLNRGLIFYRDPHGTIQSSPFQHFQKLVDEGKIQPETRVFDTTLRSLSELREGAFEVPFEESWHARSFPIPAALIRPQLFSPDFEV